MLWCNLVLHSTSSCCSVVQSTVAGKCVTLPEMLTQRITTCCSDIMSHDLTRASYTCGLAPSSLPNMSQLHKHCCTCHVASRCCLHPFMSSFTLNSTPSTQVQLLYLSTIRSHSTSRAIVLATKQIRCCDTNSTASWHDTTAVQPPIHLYSVQYTGCTYTPCCYLLLLSANTVLRA
jgi:hypothetical protein